MSALPRPAVTGPARVLNDALHELHHRAGWPSLRVLARETGVSHTTVSKAFSRPGLPSWGTLELLVESMGGDTPHFRRLWLAASAPDDDRAPTPGIAGRHAELETVRRHLETGTGLLLVTGEAGIGKTTLAQAAAERSDVVVARGSCLPLSTEIPLLPVADCLRSAYEADTPRFGHVVDACPPFVAAALSSLVPELAATTGDPVRTDDRVLLFSAIASVLKALAADARTVLVVEDLHWSDSATLDLLEHLVGGSSSVPLVGTWRSGDPATPGSTQEWFERVRRLRETTVLALGPLSREETAHQLALLGADAAQVDAIHARSRGQPLFTEQLAAHLDDGTGLPGILADLLDSRLVGLSGGAWSVVRALGLAERPLPTAPLATVCGLTGEDLTSVLHELRARRLLRTSAGEHAELEHPLLAEAVRRRLVAGEGLPIHRALARALGAQPDPEAAEVAEHWRRAGEPAEELGWRVAAARHAAGRFDRRQEADHWLRVIEIWPATGSRHPDPPVTRAEAFVGAMDALRASFRFNEAAALSEAADELLAEADEGDRADLLFRRSIYRGDPEGFESGLALLEEALVIHDRLPVREGKVRALDRKQLLLFAMGRSAESRAVADEEVVAARELGDPVLLRDALMRVAWHAGIAGDVERGMALLTSAAQDSGAVDDPLGDVRLGVYATDLLLTTGAPPDAVVAAGRAALAVAREHDFDNPQVMLVRVNVAFSLLRGGRVAEAEQVVATPSDAPWDADRWPLHAARAVIDSRLGLAGAARSRIAQICAEPSTSAPRDLEFLMWAADVALWTGADEPALDHVLGQLDDVAGTAPVRLVAPALVAAARLAAHRGASRHVDDLHRLAARCGLVGTADGDDPNLAARRASLLADAAALTGSESVAAWTDAAAAWDRIGAAHDAGYCRWRAARAALRDGRGTVAARLLKQAASDAREHVPLSQAIVTTAATGT